MMDNFDKKQYLIMTVVILVMGAIGFLRCKPLIAKAGQLREIKSRQTLENLQICNQMKDLPRIGQRMKELQQQVGDYYNKIPRERQFAGLWDQIADVMNSHELKDQLIQPGQEVIGKEINSISVNIKCTGSLSQLFGFLKELDGFERVIRIEQLRLTNSVSEPGRITMNANAKIYYQFADQEQVKVQQ